ncbi:MAG: hypothetical protein GXP31_04045 [Kiritimatiellaeota bacterium]|nr:hypothetical protein [Kiritimatiellota bacterium]
MSLTLGAAGLFSAPLVLHVSPGGDDRAPGDGARPLATLRGARDRLRELRPAGGAEVLVHGGDFLLSETFVLGEQDSPPPGVRTVYRAAAGERVRLIGGVEIRGFVPFRGEILRADVAGLGLERVEPVRQNRYAGKAPGFEVFFRGKRLPLARWPNKIDGDPRWGEWAYIPKTTEKTKAWFYYGGNRPDTWSRPAEAQVHWFPWYNYMDQYIGIRSIDPAKKVIHLDGRAVYQIQPGRRYYIRNVFEELDAPGEWYFDREAKVLYLWPPGPLSTGRVVASRLGTIIRMDGVSRTTVRGFVIESCTRDAVVISGGTGNVVGGCEIRNALLDGVQVTGGSDHTVIGNDIHDVGRRGILLQGGDRKTLTPGRNRAVNNHIHHMSRMLHTYAPAVQVNGCGNQVQHNLIHDGPHMVVGVSGNDHLFEYNEIHHAMLISSHGGAFYAGRDFTARGNVVRYNRFHDINGYGIDRVDRTRGVFVYSSPVRHLPGAFGIHLDDQISGFHIYGNLFYRFGHGVIRTGGGRDTVIENNIFVDAGWAVHLDNRGMGWQKKATRAGTLMRRLKAIDYRSPPWSERYPELVDILEDRLGEPVDNIVRRNIFSQKGVLYNFSRVPADRFTCDFNVIWRGGAPVEVTGRTFRPNQGGVIPFRKWQEMGFDRNSVIADPRFVDAARDDYRLRPDSPALALGFKPIPVEKIGLVVDEYRRGPLPPPDPRKESGEQVIEEFPIPGWTPPAIPVREAAIPQSRGEIVLDGRIHVEEWGPEEAPNALPMEVDYAGRKIAHPSRAWVSHDGVSLYVAIRNRVSPEQPVAETANWGRDDAVEVALQDVSGTTPGPVIVLRGYPSGAWTVSPVGGAPAALVRKLRDTVTYAAAPGAPGTWEAEWRIPLAAIGVAPPRPAAEPRLRFNVTAFKAAGREWAMWHATGGNSFRVENAGFIRLALPGGG